MGQMTTDYYRLSSLDVEIYANQLAALLIRQAVGSKETQDYLSGFNALDQERIKNELLKIIRKLDRR
uniref:Uncharacterized protein n=1 Tax=Thermosporothrix sp. COM3 TaxID=2490863 RepID=A0A455SNV6_9CHLR|nr:hypothetical protein KTC_48640 [Thermosporothrix sp. COM3]BBH90178.1 hypothetical protein KTC_49290 [Thermosporothrix sp. COM3]BBH90243.1 hypothetical protein KTC_49940 [Thermosporothrix sp. COM3]